MSDQSLPDDPDPLVARARPYRSGDLDALVALARACRDADGGLPLSTEPGFLAARWGASGATTRLMSGGGTLVAAAVLRDGPRLSVLVHPAVRPDGVEATLLDWGVARAPDATVETESLTADRERLLRSRGLRQVFAEDVLSIDLADPVPPPDWPPGITLSTWSEATAERFHTVYAAAFRERPGFPGLPAPEWIAEVSGDDSFRPEWSVLVSDAGGAARLDGAAASDDGGSGRGGSGLGGSVDGGSGRGGAADTRDAGFVTVLDGWIDQVGVMPYARGRGLGAALVREALTRMRAAGGTEAWLCVNVTNPARRLYERLGFTVAGRRARFRADPPGTSRVGDAAGDLSGFVGG